jgi:YVTN family beta-propeller protein
VGIRLSGDGRHAFVALGPSDRVAVVDTATYQVESYILVGRRVWQLALNAAGTRLYTTNGVSGDVTVIDAATFKPIRTVKVGRFPWGVAARPLSGPAAPDGRAAGAAP